MASLYGLKIKIVTYLFVYTYITAVINTPYDIWVDGKEVFMGNVAFLRCFIPDHVKDYVSATSWYRDEEILLPELSDIGKLFYII